MLRLFSIIMTIISVSLIGYMRVWASSIYIPGAMISLTGSTSSVRFDVASVLLSNSSTLPPPTLITATSQFTGTFYIRDIGWAVFSSGSNQVWLSCSEALSSLTSLCSLTGTGWSDNIGDIDFSAVKYNPTTGLLEWSLDTYVGDISVTGIALPIRPISLRESALSTDVNTALSIDDAWIYMWWDDILSLEGSISGRPTTSRSYVGSTSGIWTSVDLSLAGTYRLTLTDTSGSQTIIDREVTPSALTTTLDTRSSLARTFCMSAPSDILCPDGNIRSATTLSQMPPTGPVYANGTDSYSLTLRPRDIYGNRITSGSVDIRYVTTVKNIQTNFGDNINYIPSFAGDAVVWDFANIAGGRTRNYLLDGVDRVYTISSTAPTGTNNDIGLASVSYLATDIALGSWKSPLIFAPIYTASTTILWSPTVNRGTQFDTRVTKNDPSTTLTPTVISTLRVGTTSSSKWWNLSSTPAARCVNYPLTATLDDLCDWDMVSTIATVSGSDFVYTGTYTSPLREPLLEPTILTSMIYYTLGSKEILYQTASSSIGSPTTQTERVHILGQSGEWVSSASSRSTLINSIREKVALLSRNRTNYDDVDYRVIRWNYSLDTMDIWDAPLGGKSKRTLIVIGGDISIGIDIPLADHPIALIALTDMDGNGGDIEIGWAVKDIHASLIAEHGVISSVSSNQLYIHGSLVSATPARSRAPLECPYYVPTGCILGNYDLPGQRDGFATLSDKTGRYSIWGSLYSTPIVIESDSRLLSDPPSVLGR